jgi:hypothetical protein
VITQYIPDRIGEVVSKVDEVLSTQYDFNVNYDWGHDLPVINNLSRKDKDISRPKKYPLVWFVMNFKESMGNIGVYARLTGIRIYIMTSTKVNYTMKERRDNTFLPILYPIYAELIKQFSLSETFKPNSEMAIEHTKIDMPYWSEDGQKTNFYNDFIDAIQIADLKLDVKRIPQTCTTTLLKN